MMPQLSCAAKRELAEQQRCLLQAYAKLAIANAR